MGRGVQEVQSRHSAGGLEQLSWERGEACEGALEPRFGK